MLPGIATQELGLPPIADKLKNKTDVANYSVKYFKADMDDLTEMSELQVIMTRGIDGSSEIIVLKEEAYVFMAQRFICVQYLEKNPD